MKRLFGGKSNAPPPPTLTEATEKADARIQQLTKKIDGLESELRTYREQMKRLKPGAAQNSIKQRAMRTLKQKKMYEQQRDQLMNQAFNMEQAQFTTQMLQDTVTTVSAMKQANVTMKKQFKDINIDSIEDLYDDMAELMEDNDLIQEAMGRSFSTPEGLDESELEAELDALGDELLFDDAAEEVPSYLMEAAAVPNTLPVSAVSQQTHQPMNVQIY